MAMESDRSLPYRVVEVMRPFIMEVSQYREIMDLMEAKMEEGLSTTKHSKACLKMFPSYVMRIPTGKETGKYIAIDLGGTNFRILLVTMSGEVGTPPKINETIYAIPNSKMTGTGEELFDFITDYLEEFLKFHNLQDVALAMGFTFSFPCKQQGLSSATLINWTKGFNVSDVVGEDVVKLLQNAISKRGISVRCVAIVNDTVGTLTACALDDPKCAIGLIVGTGTNAAYVEDISKVQTYGSGTKPPEGKIIINMEWGAFGDDGCLDHVRTKFDRQLDESSMNPGKQMFEKCISGMYLGELVRLILVSFIKEGLLFKGKIPDCLNKKNSFLTKYISETERDPPNLYYCTNYMLTEDVHVPVVEPSDCRIVRYVCEAVAGRSAYMAGAGIACILRRLKRSDVTVGIDGSLFKFHPKYPERMTQMIHELKNDNSNFVLRLSEDGSGKGAAAIAAAETFHLAPST